MKTNLFLKPIYFIALLAFVLSCTSDPVEVPIGAYERGVLIINEGAFGANDGEVYHYDLSSDALTPNVFETVNGRPFAGLVQDVVIHGDHLYIVANTGKVEVVGQGDFKSVGAVNGSELHISRSLISSQQKLFVSDWGPYDENWSNPDSFLAVVSDLKGGSISRKIPVPSGPERMAEISGKIWVACAAARELAIVDPEKEEVVGQVELEQGSPYSFFQYNGQWYVFARDDESIYLHRINPANSSISETVSIPLANTIYNGNFALGENGEIFVITSSGSVSAVAKVSLSQGQVIDEKFYEGRDFYGLGYDSSSERLFVGEHAGWQGNGTVKIVDKSGQLVESVDAGRGPSGFVFR